MTVPVIEIQGIGPKTAAFLKECGILTAKDLLKDDANCLRQAPGFGNNRAQQVLKLITTELIVDSKNTSKQTEGKKGKKKNDKKNSRKKDKDKKKDKKKSKDKKKNKRK